MFLKSKIHQEFLALRPEDPENLRTAHAVQNHAAEWTDVLAEAQPDDLVLWGYADDRGVQRNGGRVGAVEAPDQIRNIFYKFALHKPMKIWDLGNLSSWTYELQEAQDKAQAVVQEFKNKKLRIVTLGGGHDWAYSDFMSSEGCLINLDAHLDVRPQPKDSALQNHSGTPFRRLLDKKTNLKVMALGLQKNMTSPQHLEWAHAHMMRTIFADEIPQNIDEALTKIEQTFELKSHKNIDVSLDMDVFLQAVAPGVSAPSSVGIDPALVKKFLRSIKAKSSHLGIYELNPRFDRDFQTARLAASMIYDFIF